MAPTEEKPKFDLGKQADTRAACNKGRRIELISPADQSSTGIFITMLGRDSDVFDQAVNEQIDTANRLAALLRARGKTVPPKTQVQIEKDQAELIVACVVDWENMVVDGDEVPYSVSAALGLLERFPWIRKQLDDAIGDVASFMKS
jgi:hypothetical protein